MPSAYGLGLPCGGCGCEKCDECTRTCTNPHTGDPFETVYTFYALGAEAGNPGPAYLTAVGDVDTSDPYDGMDGTAGPWEQAVSGTFSLTPSTTRYPCSVFIKFWRSHFALGAATIPPASDVLTAKTIRITNEASSTGDIVVHSSMIPPDAFGNTTIAPGEYLEFEANDISLVSGAGDQSEQDLRKGFTAVMVSAACGNDSVTFGVSAKIVWNTRARQHVLYGRVMECYSDQTCTSLCSPYGVPSTTYVAFSNLSVTSPSGVTTAELDALSAWLSGTYAMDFWLPSLCNYWVTKSVPAAGWVGDLWFDITPAGFILSGGLRDAEFRFERFSESWNWTIYLRDTNRTNSCLNAGWSGTASVVYYGNTPAAQVGTVDFTIT